jgi:hypothetical protein
VGLFSAPEKRVFEHTGRAHPIYFDFPFKKLDDVTVELPLGWLVSSTPPAQDQGGGKVVGYKLRVDHDAGALHWTREMSVDALLLDAKYYAAVRSFYEVVRTADEGQIVLQPATATSN